VKRLLPDVGPARQSPAFRRLLAGGLLSSLGSSMTEFAVVLQVWELSRSSLDVGLLGLTFVPVLIIGQLGGAIADVLRADPQPATRLFPALTRYRPRAADTPPPKGANHDRSASVLSVTRAGKTDEAKGNP
jgi:hypothetical protein